ncbi:MAG TPA: dephospho-CoA kinase [Leptolyngbyaceae cyanobacterium]
MGQRVIGLTGGIATGKSTVSQYLLDRYDIPVLDADQYAREAVALGSPILDAIAQRYGFEILLPEGSLNRAKLGDIIFNNLAEKHWLEQRIHPFVRQRFAQEMQQLQDSPVVVHAIPLLFEANLTDQVTEIWVVACSEDQQRQRLMQRNQLTLAQADARIHNQMPLTEKLAQADICLDNSTSLESLYHQIDLVLQQGT